MKQLKNLFPIFLFFAWALFFAGNLYFQNYSIGNVATELNRAPTTINRLHIVNTSTNTVWVKFYDFARFTYTASNGTITATYTAVPTYTNNPKYIYPLDASIPSIGYISQIQPITTNTNSNFKSVLTFTAGCWVRCTQNFAVSSTVTPSDSVYIDADF